MATFSCEFQARGCHARYIETRYRVAVARENLCNRVLHWGLGFWLSLHILYHVASTTLDHSPFTGPAVSPLTRNILIIVSLLGTAVLVLFFYIRWYESGWFCRNANPGRARPEECEHTALEVCVPHQHPGSCRTLISPELSGKHWLNRIGQTAKDLPTP